MVSEKGKFVLPSRITVFDKNGHGTIEVTRDTLTTLPKEQVRIVLQRRNGKQVTNGTNGNGKQ